jgi:hypothetical protein
VRQPEGLAWTKLARQRERSLAESEGVEPPAVLPVTVFGTVCPSR